MNRHETRVPHIIEEKQQTREEKYRIEQMVLRPSISHGILLFIGKKTTQKQKNSSPHYYNIDTLKAFSALLVILIHVLSRYKGNPYMEQFWIWSHFSVGAFIIASGFLQAITPLDVANPKNVAAWFWKRVVRLLGPYYVYLLIHISLTIILPGIFDDQHFSLNMESIRNTLLLHGGFASGWVWIPRIFILMTGMYAINAYVYQKVRSNWAYYVPLIFSLLISVIFFFNRPDFSIKYIQALSWYSLFIFGFLMHGWWKNERVQTWILAISGSLTIGLSIALISMDRSTNIFNHKYPPTIYFLSYNIFAPLVVFCIAPQKLKGTLKKIIAFLSRYSYEIFFAHIIVIDALGQITTIWWIDYLATVAITLGAVAVWHQGAKALSNHFNNGLWPAKHLSKK